MGEDKDRGGGAGTCPHCGVDPAREVCGRHGWCLLTPLQRAMLAPHPEPQDDEEDAPDAGA